ncbi:glycosyltransferase family 2 protein [Flavobacteriaceae bacterium LYZ1037]|nr:glycosyltransferase family 2 protein [Flavobacteriaceae bacterium LYZ1037]
MSVMDKSIAIIIVTYNGMPWIEACLNSCKAYPVIVVDNNSSDHTVSFIKTNFNQVILLEQKVNLGFGQANNIGISKALSLGFESVFLLNQDAYLGEHCLEKLLKASNENPNYGILSPIHTNGKGLDYDVQFFKYANIKKNHLPSDFNKLANSEALFQVPYINAAAWLVSKSCLQKVGGFDPLFFHYGEDNNYCQRVHYHGFLVGVLTSAYVRHDRESRPKAIIKHGSVIYFNRLERKLKSRYGDITKVNLSDLTRLQKKRFNECMKECLKGNFMLAKSKLKEVILIKNLFPLIKESRERNKTNISQRYL